MYWNVIVISLCSLLLIFLLWKEVKWQNRSWLVARIIASVLTVVSLALLALPVTIQKQQTNNSVTVILLTEGFNNDSVQTISSANNDVKIFTTSKAIKAFNATYITDASSLADSFDNKAIHIFGNGLNESELSLLKNTPVIFHPAVIENSITSIDWTKKLTSGEPLLVQGSFNNSTASPLKIVLSGFNTNLDSVTLSSKQTSYLQLTTTPKHLDKAIYTLTVLSGKDTLQKEIIPVEVKTATPLSILLIAASPDFENKFLKNWLSKNEYKFAVRTTISTNKYDKEFINISPLPLDRITGATLDKFDIAIADASALTALPFSDLAGIKNYVESKGGGLIVKTDNAENSSKFFSSSFPITEVKDSIQHIIKLSLIDSNHLSSSLKTEQPIYIRSLPGTQSLVRDQHLRTMVNSKMYGSGKILLTTIGNTYSWQLSGNTKDYASYWSYLLQKAAKKIPAQQIWNTGTHLPQKNEEVNFKLQTSGTGIPQMQKGEDIAYTEQNYLLPYEWKSTYWPSKAGWRPLIGKDSTYWWYVYDNTDWKSIKALDKINVTKKYAAVHQYLSSNTSVTSIRKSVEFSKIYFFILLIICSAFLWAEKKFNNS